MQLLIDENLSPRLALWACRLGYPAEAAVHVGLAGATDDRVFAQALRRDQVVVTVNVSDFMTLASGVDVHPGVIALREAELRAEQQWQRLKGALAYAEQHCEATCLTMSLRCKQKASGFSMPSLRRNRVADGSLTPANP